MSEQLVIEPARFAREGRKLAGRLAVDALPRLAEAVQPGSGEVSYEISGFITSKGHIGLRLSVSAAVGLVCNRCLEGLTQQLDSSREIVLVPGADEFAQPEDESDTEDIIPEVARLDIRELVEDELLLAMPLAAHHDECAAPDVSGEDPLSAARLSPFAALSRLKKD
ncbi:MAG: DUF177 domain-containing protein [Burkholderiales bacterium]|nr:DUF177 domain-containing protein [Burkholderiales bacterium]